MAAIGRNSETKVQPEGWEQFWNMSGQDMRKAGLAVKDRRCVLGTLLAVIRVSDSTDQVYPLVHGEV